jgi:hypothetical protein
MRRLSIEAGTWSGAGVRVVERQRPPARRARHARRPTLERCEARIAPSGVAPGVLAVSSHFDRGALDRPIESI